MVAKGPLTPRDVISNLFPYFDEKRIQRSNSSVLKAEPQLGEVFATKLEKIVRLSCSSLVVDTSGLST